MFGTSMRSTVSPRVGVKMLDIISSFIVDVVEVEIRCCSRVPDIIRVHKRPVVSIHIQ